MVNAVRYAVDEATATVVFTASSSVHPIRSAAPASGWILGAIAEGSFVESPQAAGRLEVALAGLSSGNPLIDREMKRRLRSGTHPTIVAELESVAVSDATGATLTGTIEFLGVSTLVEGEVLLEEGPRLVGTGEFDIRWWGLEPPSVFMLKVDPIVTVEIDLPLLETL